MSGLLSIGALTFTQGPGTIAGPLKEENFDEEIGSDPPKTTAARRREFKSMIFADAGIAADFSSSQNRQTRQGSPPFGSTSD
jgi:hypothetical protein